ncbi:cupin domain-containing protein [Ancylobacter oerskovii]|uniref:Cupin domain-containing protein n=1 Tax=Ancylobacter oerskovii TaxID=459519 RepID=A0ABW4YY55_9HYPH|nr:cupin domain-containing protein [Ancylobacter oerskovii]MBS7541885.1 cupin domain-containing protein [Ancylobacter oerskovii]
MPATTTATERRTINEGAFKAGDGAYLFQLDQLSAIEGGPGYSTAIGSVVEGIRTQCGLMRKAAGTGARPHSHPNEQWNYVVKGRLRVNIEGQPEQIAGPGTLIYFPPGIIHSTVALPEEDVLFFVVKDTTHGIAGRAADGTMSGGHYDKPASS